VLRFYCRNPAIWPPSEDPRAALLGDGVEELVAYPMELCVGVQSLRFIDVVGNMRVNAGRENVSEEVSGPKCPVRRSPGAEHHECERASTVARSPWHLDVVHSKCFDW
jgi:hypothetical protein